LPWFLLGQAEGGSRKDSGLAEAARDKVVSTGLGTPSIGKVGVREGLSPINKSKPCHKGGQTLEGVSWIQIHNQSLIWWGILRQCRMERRL
jgi:hypothetical protein